MRTNIEIDDALMAAAMEAGGFKTKKEAVEEGLRLVRRRQVYEGLLALRGKLQWDDSDGAWARVHDEEPESLAVQEPMGSYGVKAAAAKPLKPTKAGKPAARVRSQAK